MKQLLKEIGHNPVAMGVGIRPDIVRLSFVWDSGLNDAQLRLRRRVVVCDRHSIKCWAHLPDTRLHFLGPE
jgi:hypothetical protein